MRFPLGLRGWRALRHSIPRDTAIDALRYVVLDTELTSLDARSNRLLSVGAIAMQGARIELGQQLYRVVNPGVAVPGPGVLIHGLRPADVAGGEPPLQVLEELREFARNAVLVGHCISIDLAALRKETAGGLGNPAIDTARVEDWILRNGPYTEDLTLRLENLDLLSVARRYGIEIEAAHHALGDAFGTARLWQRMLRTLEGMGVRKVDKLLRIGGV
jgi:DNA polymerase-3 subunit epsilon